ncbi:ABC transporter ATP-binding protein [Amorphus sp. MBR-141]
MAAADTQAAGFEVRGLDYAIDGTTILSGLDLTIEPGSVTGLIGHNGSGKSTLVRILGRQLAATSGSITFAGSPLSQWGERAFARSVAYLPQETGASVGLTVRELVGLGRYPWHGPLGRFGRTDHEKVAHAIERCGLETFADRIVDTLSGGERQRAWIAMTLAQDTGCLLLDEPTSALDIAHQIDVLGLIHRLCREKNMTGVVVLHDVNMAGRFCDRIHALKGGRLVASGTPETIMTPAQLGEIYGIEMQVMSHPTLGTPVACAG